MAAPVVQVRIPEDMLAAVDGARGDGTRSAWILALIERELLDDAAAPGPAASPVSTSSGLVLVEPSPGVACMAPTCWERNTARYGLRRVPICPADAAALEGRVYQRQAPPGAARLMRGAA